MVDLIQPVTIFWLVKSVNLHIGCILIDGSLVLPFYLCFFLFASHFHCLFFLVLVILYDVFLIFLFFCVLCLCSRFMFCGYHEDFVKRLINEMVFFLLMSFYLHLPIIILSSSSPVTFFVVANMLWVYFKLELDTVNFLLCFSL